MTFNIHDNSYCVYVKTFPEAQAHCIEKQCKIREKCRGGSFVGTCYAGVREYVYPIIKKGDVCGFISVSAYKTENADSYIKKTHGQILQRIPDGYKDRGCENASFLFGTLGNGDRSFRRIFRFELFLGRL